MAEIIDAVTRFRTAEPLRYTGDDPCLLAIQNLPLQAGLATRVRTMIEAGSTDETVDLYIGGWIESARSAPSVSLHRDIDALASTVASDGVR